MGLCLMLGFRVRFSVRVRGLGSGSVLGLRFWVRVGCLSYILDVRVRRFGSMLRLNVSDRC